MPENEEGLKALEDHANGQITAVMSYDQYILIATTLANALTKEQARLLDGIDWRRTR